MFEFFCGGPEIIVPDNLKSAVTRACRYDPDINPAYAKWANHHGPIIIPPRPRKPKDKAKVEKAVQIVERSVLAPIRNEQFTRIEQLSRRVKKLSFTMRATSPFSAACPRLLTLQSIRCPFRECHYDRCVLADRQADHGV